MRNLYTKKGKEMEILYKVHNGLYVNLTNRCPCDCTFCLRHTMERVGESESLWLEHEPSFAEVQEAFTRFDMTDYDELVFCGFGEPTEALSVLLKTAEYVKNEWNTPIRLNTNGLGNLINKRDITTELAGLVDTVSISLNTPDKYRYNEIVRSTFGERSFKAMLDFASRCTKCIPKVIMTTVETTITRQEEAECRKICDSIGAVYRIRAWEGGR